MKRLMAVSFVLLLLAGCGGKSGASVDDLQRSNDDLTKRVRALEDELLQIEKKQIQNEQAMRAMAERLRDMENAVNKIELGPAPSR